MVYKVEIEGHFKNGSLYNDLETAEDIVAAAKNWDRIVLSPSYCVVLPGDTVATGWSCYETEEERDADLEGAYAPRILEY